MLLATLFTILILLVLAVVLSIILWAGSLWMQGWLYETPAGQLYWRAPAVGGGLALFYGLWVLVDCGLTGGHCGSLYSLRVSTLDQREVLKAVVKKNGQPETYRLNKAASPAYYVLVGPDGQPTTTRLTETPERILIEDGGKTAVFEPERDAKGNFRREQGQNLFYYDKSGRFIEEGNPGQIQRFHWDWLLWNVLFNLLHLGLWFVGLWLVLRYQWAHALGFAVCLWLTMTLFPIPMVMDYAQAAFRVAVK
jgi:hypothetical protein